MSEQHDTLVDYIDDAIAQAQEALCGRDDVCLDGEEDRLRLAREKLSALRSPTATSLPDGVDWSDWREQAALAARTVAIPGDWENDAWKGADIIRKRIAAKILAMPDPAPAQPEAVCGYCDKPVSTCESAKVGQVYGENCAQPEAAGDVVEASIEAVIDAFGAPASDADTKHLMRAAIVRYATLAHPPQAKLDGMEEAAKVAEIRTLVLQLHQASGCSCCRDEDAWDEAEKGLATAFGIARYDDDSGYNFRKALERALAQQGQS